MVTGPLFPLFSTFLSPRSYTPEQMDSGNSPKLRIPDTSFSPSSSLLLQEESSYYTSCASGRELSYGGDSQTSLNSDNPMNIGFLGDGYTNNQNGKIIRVRQVYKKGFNETA